MLQSSSPTLCLRQLNVYVDTFLSTMTCVGAPLAERVEKKENRLESKQLGWVQEGSC